MCLSRSGAGCSGSNLRQGRPPRRQLWFGLRGSRQDVKGAPPSRAASAARGSAVAFSSHLGSFTRASRRISHGERGNHGVTAPTLRKFSAAQGLSASQPSPWGESQPDPAGRWAAGLTAPAPPPARLCPVSVLTAMPNSLAGAGALG